MSAREPSMMKTRPVKSARVSGCDQEELESKRTKNNSDRYQTNHADHAVDNHTE